jgi:lysophospholipase L1-like esterase
LPWFSARSIPTRAYFLPDGIHLTAAGYALVEAVRKRLEIA